MAKSLPKAFVAPRDSDERSGPDVRGGIRVARVCESAWAIVQSRPDRDALLASRPDHPACWRELVQKFKR